MRKQLRGFTLVELILVMALIMILSVIGIGSYRQATLKSRDTERKSDLGQIAKALELFNNDVGSYPTDDGDGGMLCPVEGGTTPPCGSSIKAFFNYATATYMASTPVDQSSNRIYYYDQTDGGFALYAALENNEDRDVVEDSEGVKTNWDTDSVTCGTGISCNYKLTETGLIREK